MSSLSLPGHVWRQVGSLAFSRGQLMAVLTGFEVFSRMFQKLKGTPYELSQDAANFLAGGLASNLYWLSALRAYSDDIAP